MTKQNLDIQTFLSHLKMRTRIPSNIELAQTSCGTLASVFDTPNSKIISDSIFSGIDRNPETSVLKAIVEFIERRAFSEGLASGHASCQTERSDGFAAFPRSLAENAELRARENAFAEAVERYAWAQWWDHPKFAHQLRNVQLNDLKTEESALEDIARCVPLSSVLEIRPRISDQNLELIIYFAFTENGGVLSGGACGNCEDVAETRYRALGELLRHAIASRKLATQNLTPSTFYERRLAYFAGPNGADTARARLTMSGGETIELPSLQFDDEVPHALADLVVVHRCYFEGQPDFVGGPLERLCL